MTYLSRNKIYNKIPANKNAKKIYVFCESETNGNEYRYFNYFQGFSSNIDIITIPNLNGRSDPAMLKVNAELLFFGNELTSPKYSLSKEENDEVWFVIDTDRWNEGNKINQLKDFCFSQNETKKRWFIAQSNPCFELWFYYHFYDTKPQKNEVDQCVSFKQYVHETLKGGFDCRTMPIEIKTAIVNSKNNYEEVNNQPSVFSTEVYLLGEVLITFVDEQLEKAKEMSLNYIKHCS